MAKRQKAAGQKHIPSQEQKKSNTLKTTKRPTNGTTITLVGHSLYLLQRLTRNPSPYPNSTTKPAGTRCVSTEVCDFQYVEKENIGEALVYSIRFNHDLIVDGVKDDGTPITPGSQIITKADQPYMIHPSQKPVNGKYYQITDGDRVEYKEDENGQTVEKGNVISFKTEGHTAGSSKGDESEATPTHVEAVFQGNYDDNRLIPYGVFFLAGNEYYKIEASNDQSRKTGHLRQFTAYVEIKDKDFKAEKYIADLQNNGLSNQAKIVYPSQWGEDDMSSSTTTAILPVHVASKPVAMENARIYNLQGQLVGTGAEALKSLHRGIYVMNGKKYVIR